MTSSLRDLAACIGLQGGFSVLGDFYGFFRRQLPSDPTGVSASVSLNAQAGLLHGPHIDLNIVRVGFENFSDGDDEKLDYAVYRIRNIYTQVGLGVGRVRFWGVHVSDARGLDAITSEGQVQDLGHSVTINGAIDVAVPHSLNVSGNGGSILGESPQPGPCQDKNSKGMNSSVVGLFSTEQTGRSFSHEVGHYLGLGHENDKPDNLMCQSGKASSIRNSVVLTPGQGATMRSHCLVKQGCP